jgi:branched-chain amino acid transport system substrate-binding protein
MAAIVGLVQKTGGKFTGDEAMAILSHYRTEDSPRGPISIDPETRDIVQNEYLRKVQKVDGHLANVEIETIATAIKDPWKEQRKGK